MTCYIFIILFVFAFLPESDSICIKWKTVRKGVTCETVEKENKLSHEELIALNPDINCSNLTGKDTEIPEAFCLAENDETDEKCLWSHYVKKGDNPRSISVEYGLSKRQRIQLNPHLNFRYLTEGQEVCVKGEYTQGEVDQTDDDSEGHAGISEHNVTETPK